MVADRYFSDNLIMNLNPISVMYLQHRREYLIRANRRRFLCMNNCQTSLFTHKFFKLSSLRHIVLLRKSQSLLHYSFQEIIS